LTLSISEKDAVVNERAGKDSTMFINNIESMECPEQRVSTFACGEIVPTQGLFPQPV
jgi:hypothetical protein